MPKNIATSIKDNRFLDFFFRRLKWVDDTMHAWMNANNISANEYPFVSPCGKQELNFIRPAAAPIIFHSLVESNDGKGKQLVFGGSMAQPFDEKNGIAISRLNGRLYHRLTTHSLGRRMFDASNDDVREYGLIRSSVAVALSDSIIPMDYSSNSRTVTEPRKSSGLGFQDDQSRLLPIPWLPLDVEPGSWAMPGTADD